MRRKFKWVLKIFILLFIFSNISAQVTYALNDTQNRNFGRITYNDGLSQGSAGVIFQDSTGYIWIGTNDGLNKYNGHNFEVYRNKGDYQNSISGNKITAITEDNEGNIWVGTTVGLNKINVQTNEISTYVPNKDGCKLSHYRVRKILVTEKGQILVGTDDGLNLYDKKSDNFIRLFNSTNKNISLSNQEIYSLVEDPFGTIWVGTRVGINRIDLNTNTIERHFSKRDDIGVNHIRSLLVDVNKNLWIGTHYGGLFRANLVTGEVKHFPPIDNKLMDPDDTLLQGGLINDLYEDSRGDIWIGTDEGFSRFNSKDETFTTYRTSKYDSTSILSNNILSICEDITGSIWIGTPNGVSLFNPENHFNYYKSDPFNSNTLSDNSITGIYEDNEGLLWVGTTYNGLNIINRKNNTVTRFDHTSDYEGDFEIANNLVREIKGIDNEIWIATENGVDRIIKDTNTHIQYRSVPGLPVNDVRTLLFDSKGILWLGTRDGLASFDRKTDSFTDYSSLFKSKGVKNLTFNDIHEDDEGILWMYSGIENGLISFNPKTNDLQMFNSINSASEKTQQHNIIISIDSDDKGNIWLATDYGLIKYNKESDEHIRYTEENGLSNNFIYSLQFQDENIIWLSTNYGLSRFDINEETFTNFNSTDGIQGNEFNQFSSFKSKSGELFFGGTCGLTTFMPDTIKTTSHNTSVKIESISSNLGNLTIEDTITLSHRNNQINFKFFIPDFKDNRNIKYAYKLVGFDKEWNLLEQRNNANYTNLAPGIYTFQVAGRTSNGVWSTPTNIDIIIQSPPWKTPTAYILYFLTALIIIYLLWSKFNLLDSMVKQRTMELDKNLKDNEILYKKLLQHEKFKNNYFVNLSHELRTPLNIITSAQKLITTLNNNNEDHIPKERINHYMKIIQGNCSRLVNLIDNIINTSKIESGNYTLNIANHDIVYLVEEVSLSMKDFIEDNKINLIIDPFIEEKIIECDNLEIERVIINLISNAVKFTPNNGTIRVSIWDFDTYVKISVKDTGIGIDDKFHESIFNRFSQAYSYSSEEHGGSGLGLTLSKQLIELHKGKIWVESTKGIGSEFIITLPVKQFK
ncbi:ligand-binding sensor domain-containing protein [Clostridium sp.]|uniref:ligand-binding sensor domain-containing protein n=1 Tax=Clostridium sp. TaxID=1506 RepID=UPI003F2A44E0